MKFAILTVLDMCRMKLVTTETMEAYHNEEKKFKYNDWMEQEFGMKHSVNDDLEFFHEGLQLGLVCNETIDTFCFPKLNKVEMKQMEQKDEVHLDSYCCYDGNEEYPRENPDIDQSEMELSESKSKYVEMRCDRCTFVIQNRPRKLSDSSSDEIEDKPEPNKRPKLRK